MLIRLAFNIQEMHTKIDYLDTLRLQVENLLGRSLEGDEIRAIGFLLERTWHQVPFNPRDYLPRVLNIQEADTSAEISFKIYNAIHDARIQEAEERIKRAGVFSREAEDIRNMKHVMEATHNEILTSYLEYGSGDIHLGSVIEHWQPEWVKCIGTI